MNHWKSVVAELLLEATRSGLIENTKTIYLGVLGQERFSPPKHIRHKCKLLFHEKSLSPAECLTLNCLQKKAEQLPTSSKIWYIHTKGVSQPNSQVRQDWRRYMSYFVIGKWRYCYKCLDYYDACGVNWRMPGGPITHPHFSGNFWWANSSFITRLPPLNENNRYDAESFLGKGNPNIRCLYDNKTVYIFGEYKVPQKLKWTLFL